MEGKEADQDVGGEVKKLFDDGILWLEGDEAEDSKHHYHQDYQPGLSNREAEIIEMQCRIYLKGRRINSLLLSAADLDEVKKKHEGESDEKFVEYCVKLASVRDDKHDIAHVKEKLAGNKD